jgi:regulator of protease activity HflC (stomatin/prohibitin superfamily)
MSPNGEYLRNMEYNKIIAVTGLPGLYELLSSKSDGAIVRSLDDKTTRFVSSRIHNFSHLESIEVYTVRDNVNLADILKAMEASTDKLPDDKDATALKNYFTKVYPDLDFTRVYSSDLKKMIKWFSVLKANHIEIKLSEPEEEEVEAEVGEEKPVAATATKAATAVTAVKKKEEAEKPVAGKKATAEMPAKADKKKTEVTAAAKAEKPAAGKKVAEVGKAAAAKGKTEKTASAKKAVSKASDKPKKAAKKK